MGGVKGGSTLTEVGVARHVPHYASTPHLFVYQAAEDEDEVDHDPKEAKEPIYSSAIDIRKAAASKEVCSVVYGQHFWFYILYIVIKFIFWIHKIRNPESLRIKVFHSL